MSEAPLDTPQFQEPPPPPEVAETPEPDQKPARTPEQYEAELAKVRREAANYRTKLREVEPIAKKAQEDAEAAKTADQRNLERAEKAEKDLRDQQTGFTQLELAVQYHVEPGDIELIGSGTREEMEVRAKRVAALTAAASKAAPPPTDRPVEGLRPGATAEPAKPPDDSYPASWTPKYLRDQEGPSFYGQ